MRRFAFFLAGLLAAVPLAVNAMEPETRVGAYLYATGITGETGVGDVTADVDVGFDDILANLDLGFMGFVDHRRGRWSFLGDFAYLRLADEDSSTVGRAVEIDVEAELEQTVLSGYAGYRVYASDPGDSDIGIDLMLGVRHTTLAIDLDLDNAVGNRNRSRDGDEDWLDAVIAARIEADYRNGWGSLLWLDLGEGSDSSSYQLMALASYQGGDHWKFFGGYRFLNLEYDSGSGDSTFDVDLDYSGPMFGAAYQW